MKNDLKNYKIKIEYKEKILKDYLEDYKQKIEGYLQYDWKDGINIDMNEINQESLYHINKINELIENSNNEISIMNVTQLIEIINPLIFILKKLDIIRKELIKK